MALSKALNTDLSSLAKILQSKGRGKDTVLAHITPKEAALLKARGGRGSRNPDTGLLEFDDGEGDFNIGNVPSLGDAPVTQAPAIEQPSTQDVSPNIAATPGYGEGAPTGNATQVQESGFTAPQFSSVPAFSPADIQAGTAPTPAQLTSFRESAPAPSDVSGAMASLSQSGLTQPQTDKNTLFQQAAKALGISTDTLGKGALATGLGAYNAIQNRQAQAGNDAAVAQKQALAAPYQQQGQQLVGAAQRSELTPANQQVIQQQRARLAQASANMGGVGQQQIENQISSLTANLLQNQYQYGLQVMQIGDNISLGAINTQLQLDQQLNAANKQFYMGLANLVAGSPTYINQTKVGG